MRIKRTFWIACGARGVTQNTGGLFRQLRPFILSWMRRKKILIAQQIKRRVGHMGTICHHNIAHICRQLVDQCLNDWYESQIQKQQAVCCVMGDVNQLLGTQTRIDRMADSTDARDAKIQFEMPVPVPRQGCDAIPI